MVFEGFFGNELVNAAGEKIPVASLEGKTVLIYFSAHWCPPCRGFTPMLAQFYKTLKAKRTDFEIVFVSSDRDEKAFEGYLGEMPWVALPFSDRDQKGKLSQKYSVTGIPTLVVVDSAGELITREGRRKVNEDPEGASFPWTS